MTGEEPGGALLDETDLASYLYNGEVFRSTHGPQLLEAINASGRLTDTLRRASGAPPAREPVHELKELAAGLHSLVSSLRPGPAQASLSRDVQDFLGEIGKLDVTLSNPKEPPPPEWPAALGQLTSGISPRLVEMFFSADVGATAGSGRSTRPAEDNLSPENDLTAS